MKIKKYVAIVILFLLCMITTAHADMVAEYIIQEDRYDSETKTYTAEVYLNTKDYLSTGTFGMRYDSELVFEKFELDGENFEYFQKFDNHGSNYIVFQWYISERASQTKDKIHLGTITIKEVTLDDKGNPSGWHTETLRQLDWFDTDESKEDKFTNDEDGVCLNNEIFRYVREDEEASKKGYYQGYDMSLMDENDSWEDIGFIFNSGYELPERKGKVISGVVHSYNPNNKVTAALYDLNGEIIKSVEASDMPTESNDGRIISMYELDVDIVSGKYRLEIKKDVHLTYTMNIEVNKRNISVEAITLYCGDISGDERIKLNDRTALLRDLNSTNPNPGRSDLNGDGKITLHDLNIMKKYYNKYYDGVVSYAEE